MAVKEEYGYHVKCTWEMLACLLAFSHSKRLKEDDGPESSSDASTAAVAVTCSMFCGKVEIWLKVWRLNLKP